MNLILDVCCGICLSAVLPQISENTFYLVFSGDNICCEEEYNKRKDVFIEICKYNNIQDYSIIPYNHLKYLEFIKGYEQGNEGGYRCLLCFEYRFQNLYEYFNSRLKEKILQNIKSFESQVVFFSTTLSVSKYKSYIQILEGFNNFMKKHFINNKTDEYYIKFLEKNFKNEELYKNTLNKVRELNLYSQNFCGCEFSKKIKKKFQN